MAKYKAYSYSQGQLIPVIFSMQIQPGTFQFTLNHLIDNELDLSYFDDRFKTDDQPPETKPKTALSLQSGTLINSHLICWETGQIHRADVDSWLFLQTR